MHSSAGFRLRHPLNPVDAGFKLQAGIGAVAGDHEVRLLHAAKLRLIIIEKAHLPAPAVGVHGVHTEQGVGEQGALLAAHAAANLHDDVLVVVGIPGQEQNGQLLLQFFQVLLGLGEFLLAELAHLLVEGAAQHFAQVCGLLLGLHIGAVGGHNGLQLPLLLQELGRGLGVGVKVRLGGALGHFVVAVFHRL